MVDNKLGSESGWIGKSPSRRDGPSKVAGKAKYTADLAFPGALHARVVRSPVARGRLKSVSFDPRFDWSDIVTVTAEDIPRNVMAVIKHDQPVLAVDEVRHVYEPIALMACADVAKLERAMGHVNLDIEPMEAVLSMEASDAKEHVIYGDDNVMASYQVKLGDALEVIERSEVVVRGTYEVGHQEQLYIEPQGCVAYWDDDGLHVIGSFQCPYYVENALAHALDLERNEIDVTQAVTGGAFGGKEEYPSVMAVQAAALARKAGKPVRLIYEREEDLQSTTKRHPAKVEVTTGCDLDGKLRAIHVNIWMDAGAYVTITPVVLSRGVLHACGAYEWEHALVESKALATNTPPNGAFRGFGAPQTLFALERHMDRIARTIGVDPLELRKKNLLKVGSTMPTGQVLGGSVGVEECVRTAETKSEYDRKRRALGIANASRDAKKVRGIGASVFLHGAGFTGSGEDRLKGKVAVDLLPGGRLRVRTSSVEMGQGTETVFPQIAAEAAGVSIDDIEFVQPSTAKVPDSGPTVASRTVMIVGSVLQKAASDLAHQVKREMELGGGDFAEAADRVLSNNGGFFSVVRQYASPPGIHFDDETYTGTAYPAYAWACDIAEVEVDLDTYEVDVVNFWSSVDVGRAIHPVMCRGQLDGGALQAIGWALSEQIQWKDGHIINGRMATYIVPTILDAPKFITTLVEEPYDNGPGGAKGIGELPMDGGAPAVAAAIEHATGLSVDKLPISPERLLQSWLDQERQHSEEA